MLLFSRRSLVALFRLSKERRAQLFSDWFLAWFLNWFGRTVYSFVPRKSHRKLNLLPTLAKMISNRSLSLTFSDTHTLLQLISSSHFKFTFWLHAACFDWVLSLCILVRGLTSLISQLSFANGPLLISFLDFLIDLRWRAKCWLLLIQFRSDVRSSDVWTSDVRTKRENKHTKIFGWNHHAIQQTALIPATIASKPANYPGAILSTF